MFDSGRVQEFAMNSSWNYSFSSMVATGNKPLYGVRR
jgi:hypothetical protein